MPMMMAGMDQSALLPRMTNRAPVTTAVMEVLAANQTNIRLRGEPCRSSGGMKSIERRSTVAVFAIADLGSIGVGRVGVNWATPVCDRYTGCTRVPARVDA
ncbi:hypothetical protein SAT01_20970 [Sinomonas atrocyanea]|nr:hypothetical protein SAT01_20970 [Sinomonas atrocyanea]GGG72019.1 hypothetical protein GCM10007172_25520 [Sinomonas atrocyanea]